MKGSNGKESAGQDEDISNPSALHYVAKSPLGPLPPTDRPEEPWV